jgi:hypothetical protein
MILDEARAATWTKGAAAKPQAMQALLQKTAASSGQRYRC